MLYKHNANNLEHGNQKSSHNEVCFQVRLEKNYWKGKDLYLKSYHHGGIRNRSHIRPIMYLLNACMCTNLNLN